MTVMMGTDHNLVDDHIIDVVDDHDVVDDDST